MPEAVPHHDQTISPDVNPRRIKDLDYMVSLGEGFAESAKDIKAMLLAATERNQELSPDTHRLFDSLKPANPEGLEIRLLRLTAELEAIKSAIFKDGVLITAEEMVDLRRRFAKPEDSDSYADLRTAKNPSMAGSGTFSPFERVTHNNAFPSSLRAQESEKPNNEEV